VTQRTVLFISKGENSASTRYRAFNYFPYLREAGWLPQHLTAAQGPLSRLNILRQARRADVVVIVRKTLSPLFLRLLRKASRRLVFDFDDAIFVRSNGEPSRRRQQGFRRTMAVCDAVWAGNRYLAGAAARLNSHVSLLPTSIRPERPAMSAAILTLRPNGEAGDDLNIGMDGSLSSRKRIGVFTICLPKSNTLREYAPLRNFDPPHRRLKS
jgi:hypothetical protein